jgi:hypothetical protein
LDHLLSKDTLEISPAPDHTRSGVPYPESRRRRGDIGSARAECPWRSTPAPRGGDRRQHEAEATCDAIDRSVRVFPDQGKGGRRARPGLGRGARQGEACPAPRPSVGFVGPRGFGPRGGFFSIRMSVSHDTQASKTRRRRRTSPLAGCRPAASDAVRDEGVASAWRQISHDHERVPSRWMHRGPPGPRGGSSRCEGPIGASRDAPGPRDTDRGHVGPASA